MARSIREYKAKIRKINGVWYSVVDYIIEDADLTKKGNVKIALSDSITFGEMKTAVIDQINSDENIGA